MKIILYSLTLLTFRSLLLGETITPIHNATLNGNALKSNWLDLEFPSSVLIEPSILIPQSSGRILHTFVSLTPRKLFFYFSADYSLHNEEFYLDQALRVNQADLVGNFIESDYFLTSAGHQAFYIRYNDSTAKDIYEIWIDGKTQGYSGSSNNWLTVRFEIKSLESLIELDEAKSFANWITFKGGKPKPLKNLVKEPEIQTIETPLAQTLSKSLQLLDIGNGWGDSSWFGYTWINDSNDWIYHMPLGWLFVHVNKDGSLWLYSADILGERTWFFTSSEIFPYLYSIPTDINTPQGWMHINIKNGKFYSWDSLNLKWNGWTTNDDANISKNESDNDNNDNSTTEKQEMAKLGAGKKIHRVASASDLEMIWVEPGTFSMNPSPDKSRKSYSVTLTKGYYLGKFEVTHKQAVEVLPEYSDFLTLGDRAVGNVSWDLANQFCEKLTIIETKNGRLPQGWKFTLPTEAEWEYACRAGTNTNYWWGDFKKRRLQFPHIDSPKTETGANRYAPQIGLFPPNPWGFYDMHGNVSEWCSDWHSENYSTVPVTNPNGPLSGSKKIIRGASPYYEFLTSGYRLYMDTWDNHDSHGLRLVLRF